MKAYVADRVVDLASASHMTLESIVKGNGCGTCASVVSNKTTGGLIGAAFSRW